MMQISIIKPGLLSAVQDLGRSGYLSQAVPFSGAMDTLSAQLANIAVGNDRGAAVIEFTYAGASFKAETDLLIAYAGEGAVLFADEKRIPPRKAIFIPQGITVNLVNNPIGSRTYLAVAGGLDIPVVLGSRSTFLMAALGGLEGRALKAGDVLNSIENTSVLTQKIKSSLQTGALNYSQWTIPVNQLLPPVKNVIRVVPGNEFTWFNSQSIINFLSEPYRLYKRSNRMGYILEGATLLRNKQTELLSTAVTPGTIQVSGDGSAILLMADCQTTGGYPRIAQAATVDMPLCGQLKPGDTIYFTETGRHEAEMLYIEREQQLQQLARAVYNRYL